MSLQSAAPHITLVTILFIMLCKMVVTFMSVDEILKCDQTRKDPEVCFSVVSFVLQYTQKQNV